MKIQSPQIGALREMEDLADAVAAAVREEDDVRGCLFSDLEWKDAAVTPPLEFRQCVFENCRFPHGSLAHLRLTDVIFRGCDLSNLDLTACSTQRCAFIDCKAVGLLLAGARLRHVTMTGCNLQLANLSGCSCTGAAFSDCDFSGGALQGCSLGKAALTDCRLIQVNLTGTSLSGIDLTSCQLDGLSLNGEELRGAVVTPYQAAELAKFLGLVIREGDGRAVP